MSVYESVYSCLRKKDDSNIYRITEQIGLRAIQILSGSPPKIDTQGEFDPVKVAYMEYLAERDGLKTK